MAVDRGDLVIDGIVQIWNIPGIQLILPRHNAGTVIAHIPRVEYSLLIYSLTGVTRAQMLGCSSEYIALLKATSSLHQQIVVRDPTYLPAAREDHSTPAPTPPELSQD